MSSEEIREVPAPDVGQEQDQDPLAHLGDDDLAAGVSQAFGQEPPPAAESEEATPDPSPDSGDLQEEVAPPSPDEVEPPAGAEDEGEIADLLAHPDDDDHSLLARTQRLANTRIRDQAYEAQENLQRAEAAGQEAQRQKQYWQSAYAGLWGHTNPGVKMPHPQDDGFDAFADQPPAASARLDDAAEPAPVADTSTSTAPAAGELDDVVSAFQDEAASWAADPTNAQRLHDPEFQKCITEVASRYDVEDGLVSAASPRESRLLVRAVLADADRRYAETVGPRRAADQAQALRNKKRVSAAAAASGPPASPRRRPADPHEMPLDQLRKALDSMSNR